MELSELTTKMDAFVRAKGWYRSDSNRPQTAKNLAISLSLEAGEVLEHFQWDGIVKNKIELGEELADVALYLLQLAFIAEIDLEQAILNKLDSNATREWD
jgi:8-oxo-dGTP diphosphatase